MKIKTIKVVTELVSREKCVALKGVVVIGDMVE
jgi:hypothetical protein